MSDDGFIKLRPGNSRNTRFPQPTISVYASGQGGLHHVATTTRFYDWEWDGKRTFRLRFHEGGWFTAKRSEESGAVGMITARPVQASLGENRLKGRFPLTVEGDLLTFTVPEDGGE